MGATWKRPRKRRIRGLGDVVHEVAGPIASAIDLMVGAKWGNCKGCAQRREDWNRMFPLGGPVDITPEE